MKKSLFAIVVSVLANVAFAADDARIESQAMNFFNPTAWMQTGNQPHEAGQLAAVQPGATMAFNPFHPSGWAAFVSPQTHEQAHMAFTNPANYAQFMRPQFFMQAMNPQNAMAWMNPASYGAFMNPATFSRWMNPAAFMHMINPAQYMQAANPNAYAQFMNPAMYRQWMTPTSYATPATANMTSGFNMFDPNAWGKVFSTQPGQAPAAGAPKAASPTDK